MTSEVFRALHSSGAFPYLLALARGGRSRARAQLSDWRKHRREIESIFSRAPRPQATRGTILVAAFSPWPYTNFILGAISKGLEAAGWDVGFVTNRASRSAESFLRPFGFDRFEYIEDDRPSPDFEEALKLVNACSSTDEILAIVQGGAEVGRHALSTTIGTRRSVSSNFGDEKFRHDLASALDVSIRNHAAARVVLDRVRPKTLIVSEKGYTPEAEFFDAAVSSEIDVVHWYFGAMPQELILRRYSRANRYEHYFTLTAETWARIRDSPWDARRAAAVQSAIREAYVTGEWMRRRNHALAGKRMKSREEILGDFSLDSRRPTVVVFSHILWDATFWYGRNLYPDYASWLLATIGVACEHPEANWIVKMHPDNVWKEQYWEGAYRLERLAEHRLIRSRFPQLPPHVALMPPEDDTNPFSLFEVADVGVTVRGTIGMELPCFGVPVLTAGTGRYSGRGFTLDPGSVEEYERMLSNAARLSRLTPRETALAQRFAFATFFAKPLPITSFKWARVVPARYPEQHRMTFDFEESDALLAAADLRSIAEFVDSREPEMIGRRSLLHQTAPAEQVPSREV